MSSSLLLSEILNWRNQYSMATKPIAIKRHQQVLPQIFRLDLPEELILGIEGCRDNKQVRALGIEWAIQQSKDLIAKGAPVVHFYSMGKSDNIKAIAKEVF